LCRDSLIENDENEKGLDEGEMVNDEEKSVLNARTAQTVQELKLALSYQYATLFLSKISKRPYGYQVKAW
jgi:hypothetical protein